MSTSKTDVTIGAVALPVEQFPVVGERALMKEALEVMTQHRIGVTCIVGADNTFRGLFTDGDLRRLVLKSQKPFAALLADDIIAHAHTECLTVSPDDSLLSAVQLMEDRRIWDLPVLRDGRLVGLLHLHPAIKALM